MPETGHLSSPTIRWVVFPDGCGALRRLIRSNGDKGLLLQFTEHARAGAVRERALQFGFTAVGSDGAVHLMVPDGKAGFTASELAAALDGQVLDMSREKLFSYPWTVDCSAPNLGKGQVSADASEGQNISCIGRNFAGEEVFADRFQRRFAKVSGEDGKSRLEIEARSGNPVRFLRARDLSDIPEIAEGLVRMAESGMVGEEDFERVLEAACQPLESGEPGVDRTPADRLARLEMLSKIVNLSMDDENSRRQYHHAMRVAENASAVIDSSEGHGEGLFPSSGFLIFLRRLTRDSEEMEFGGNERLAVAGPTLRGGSNPSLQLFDLTAANADSVVERAANILSRRAGEGQSVLLVSGTQRDKGVAAVRQSVGMAYAFEVVAELSPHVVSGRHDADPVVAFVVGERRPQPSDSLPVAALRTFKTESRGDLDSLYIELLRSRRRIREWHDDIEQERARATQEREDNERQRPYVALSSASPPFTMIAKSLEGATAKALRRVEREFVDAGGIDRQVAGSIGMDESELAATLTSEQVDAVAMRTVAEQRNRAFLLADQTGIGKGRSLATVARQHLMHGGRVLYLTENAQINIADVWRDFVAVGAHVEARPIILASQSVKLEFPDDGMRNDAGTRPGARTVVSESAASRRAIYESRRWPENCNLVLTNYSQFSGSETSRNGIWARSALGGETLLILDECHNALNPRSNTGKAIRAMIEAVGRAKVLFATATPLRNPKGANLYRSLLPDAEGDRLNDILEGLVSGGETAQESFATMLAEDGVFLRRDHDLSNIEFQVRLPDDERMARYQGLIDRFSPLVDLMLDATLRVGALVGRSQMAHYRRLIQLGYEQRSARAAVGALYQYSGAAGGPLARLARITMNAIKVDQVVEEAVSEIREGRKPLITFHSTGEAVLSDVAAGNSSIDADGSALSLKHQIARLAESIFRVRLDNAIEDARALEPGIAELANRVNETIVALPSNLPVSPVDAVIEGLARQGITSGEISGRVLAYRDGDIVRREGRDRREVVDRFNAGEIDVLIYNMAGATGGSYHAAPEFRDRRPRSLIEMETPVDIIKYIQSQGRGNRYGQVARPRIVSVMTGLVPEMRILQQRNRKLRALGASIDGNRSHPLLLDDIPDFLNTIGDQAATQVLQARPDLARRLGFPEFVQTSNQEDSPLSMGGPDSDSGASGKPVDSIANKVLSRSLVLSASEQSDLIDLICIEFDAIVEELESRNLSPLRPKELEGEIEIVATALFSGVENDRDDPDVSSFLAPLYISTGMHRYTREPIGSEQLLRMVNQSRISDGTDGFAPQADRLQANFPNLLNHLVARGYGMDAALQNVDEQSHNFRQRHKSLTRLVHLLRNMRPGRVLQMDSEDGVRDRSLRTIVKLSAPKPQHAHLPQAYRIRTVTPGASEPETISLRSLTGIRRNRIRFIDGLSIGADPRHLREFAEQCNLERSYPVQVLSGNHLAALAEARRHALGSMCLFRDQSGQMQRGIVVRREKRDLAYLPVKVASGRVAEALFGMLARGEIERSFTIWVGKRDDPMFTLRFEKSRNGFGISTMAPSYVRQKNLYDAHPELLEALQVQERQVARGFFSWRDKRSQIRDIFHGIDVLDLQADGTLRTHVNSINGLLERDRLPVHLMPDYGKPEQALAPCVKVPSGHGAEALLGMFLRDKSERHIKMWIGRRDNPQFEIEFARYAVDGVEFSVRSPSYLGHKGLYDAHPDLRQALQPKHVGKSLNRFRWPDDRARIRDILHGLEAFDLQADEISRSRIDEINGFLERGQFPAHLMPDYDESEPPAPVS